MRSRLADFPHGYAEIRPRAFYIDFAGLGKGFDGSFVDVRRFTRKREGK
jgi:hypothetical protein